MLNKKTKENVLTVILALLVLAFGTAIVGTVLSQEHNIRPLHIYVTNPLGK